MPDLPFTDTENAVARAAKLMRYFAQELQEEIEKERNRENGLQALRPGD